MWGGGGWERGGRRTEGAERDGDLGAGDTDRYDEF